LNLDPDVAFIGTPSYRNLCKWVAKMQIADFFMVNSNDRLLLYPAVSECHRNNGRVVALGNLASQRLTEAGIKHFKLPHPSPANRQLNDAYFIDQKLYECYCYLKEQFYVHHMR
jgi:hypothetical protein